MDGIERRADLMRAGRLGHTLVKISGLMEAKQQPAA